VSQKNLSATRQELMRQKRKKKTAQRGHKLLKDKRDSLMQMFVELIRETIALRKSIDIRYLEVLREYQVAGLTINSRYLELLAATPTTTITLDKTLKTVMSVKLADLAIEVKGDFLNYGMLQTNEHLDKALKLLRELLPDILRLVEKENAASRLAEEIERTRRRVNALEYVIIPEVNLNIRFIAAKLEEQARQTTVSLIKMKQRMAS